MRLRFIGVVGRGLLVDEVGDPGQFLVDRELVALGG
jgi:hypothetical protein